MAGKKKSRRRSPATSVEHVSPTAPPEPARPSTSSPLSPLLPQTQERPPNAVTPLIASSSPSSTHQERFPANPSDLLALVDIVLERSMPSRRSAIRHMPSNIKKLQGMAKGRRERAVLDATSKVSKNMRTFEEIMKTFEEILRSVNAFVGEMEKRDGGGSCFGRSRHEDDSLGSGDGTDGEDGGSTETDDGSSCGGEVGVVGGGGGNGGDTGAHVVRSVVALLLVLAVLVVWVMRSETWLQI